VHEASQVLAANESSCGKAEQLSFEHYSYAGAKFPLGQALKQAARAGGTLGVEGGTKMATKKNKKTAKKQSKPSRKEKKQKRVTPKKRTKKSARRGVKPAVRKVLLKAVAPQKKTGLKKTPVRKAPKHKIRGKAVQIGELSYENTGLGARTGGQSGDTQGLSGVAETNSESVKELLEEGQSFEAEVLEGVENVPDADEGEIRTHEVPQDDVPGEYRDKD
jgi:hypothetical protein